MGAALPQGSQRGGLIVGASLVRPVGVGPDWTARSRRLWFHYIAPEKAAEMTTRVFALCLSTGLLTGCIEKLNAPACVPVPFSQASVNGDTITTTTGLRYLERSVGPGIPVDWCRSIAIHYDAFLLDGTMFDSSRDGDPLVFAPGLGGLIDGIEQGVVGMRAGGTRRLIISPTLGFGSEPRRDASGQIVIPGNSTVVYDIEVVEVAQ